MWGGRVKLEFFRLVDDRKFLLIGIGTLSDPFWQYFRRGTERFLSHFSFQYISPSTSPSLSLSLSLSLFLFPSSPAATRRLLLSLGGMSLRVLLLRISLLSFFFSSSSSADSLRTILSSSLLLSSFSVDGKPLQIESGIQKMIVG